MRVLGLCFLIYDRIDHEELWHKWLEGVNPEKYRVYIHYKQNVPLKYFENYKLGKCIETSYGAYTITLAQNLMMKEGINDCSHFIFLSGACIPLKTFDYIYNWLENGFSYFNLSPDEQCFPRCKEVLPFIDKKYVKKANVNSIICNKHAKLILDNEHFAINYFRSIYSADEHIHITILYYLGLEGELKCTDNACYSGATTFAPWPDMKDYKKYVGTRKKNAYTYKLISEAEILDLLKSPCLIGRKFLPDCGVAGKGNLASYIIKKFGV